jgi:hypothetical protein
MLPKDIQLKLIGPPVSVPGTTACSLFYSATMKGAFAFAINIVRGCALHCVIVHILTGL